MDLLDIGLISNTKKFKSLLNGQDRRSFFWACVSEENHILISWLHVWSNPAFRLPCRKRGIFRDWTKHDRMLRGKPKPPWTKATLEAPRIIKIFFFIMILTLPLNVINYLQSLIVLACTWILISYVLDVFFSDCFGIFCKHYNVHPSRDVINTSFVKFIYA